MRPFITAIVLLFGSAFAYADSINVAVAISLKESVTEIAKAYKSDTGEDVQFTFGASGQLFAQIKNGAPIDAFISAANKQMDDLAKDKFVDVASRKVIAGNSLVLIVPADAKSAPAAFADLADTKWKKVAIGEPKTVPAGQYAAQVLKALKIESALNDRFVFGSNVRQVLNYVSRGEVDAGIVYATDAREAGEKVKVVATADSALHEPIVYPAAVVSASAKQAAARKFLDYLSTEKALKILQARGFSKATDPKPAQ